MSKETLLKKEFKESDVQRVRNLVNKDFTSGVKVQTGYRKSSKKHKHPKKGMLSKTRKGRKDFVTHKGDKYYNRKGHRQQKNKKGTRKSPYKK